MFSSFGKASAVFSDRSRQLRSSVSMRMHFSAPQLHVAFIYINDLFTFGVVAWSDSKYRYTRKVSERFQGEEHEEQFLQALPRNNISPWLSSNAALFRALRACILAGKLLLSNSAVTKQDSAVQQSEHCSHLRSQSDDYMTFWT